MTQALTIFCCQFVMVFLLGMQSQFVRDGKKTFSSITSLMIGISAWTITGIISSAYKEGMFSLVFFCFILSGPCGITTSIWLHKKKFHKGDK